MSTASAHRCPRCNRQTKPQSGLHWCTWCRALFDDDPDEGGDYHDRDPSRRLVRQEENSGNKRK